MRILWMYYHVPQYLLSEFHKEKWLIGTGWVDGLLNQLIESNNMDFGIIFPNESSGKVKGKKKNVAYFSYYKDEDEKELFFESVIKEYQPDLIHIWGSEAVDSRLMVYVGNRLGYRERMLLNLQGLCYIIFLHYRANIPARFFYFFTIRDILRWDNIALQKWKYKKRGTEEKKVLKDVLYAVGRTDWDEACIRKVNANITYFHCDEILRESFYNDQWSYTNCHKYSIFFSQGTYPVKGLHYMLQALGFVKKKYPEVILRIAGMDYMKPSTDVKSWIKRSGYARYILFLIKKYDLHNNVRFLGVLDEKQMKNEYLKANVFVSASTIENESNSLSEAKILGMPVIASYVGGISNRIVHGVDGYAYQHDAVYMLEYYLCEIFQNPEKAIIMGRNARKGALKINNIEKNVNQMIKIYSNVIERSSYK